MFSSLKLRELTWNNFCDHMFQVTALKSGVRPEPDPDSESEPEPEPESEEESIVDSESGSGLRGQGSN